jgi:hypothetical protein
MTFSFFFFCNLVGILVFLKSYNSIWVFKSIFANTKCKNLPQLSWSLEENSPKTEQHTEEKPIANILKLHLNLPPLLNRNIRNVFLVNIDKKKWGNWHSQTYISEEMNKSHRMESVIFEPLIWRSTKLPKELGIGRESRSPSFWSVQGTLK